MPEGSLHIVRPDPLCAETRLERHQGLLTDTDGFYVRNNFPIPAGWPGLEVAGAVDRPLLLGMAELDRFPQQELVVTLECAGNGRAYLDPPVAGEPWGLGAVSTARWTGVQLAALLEEAGPRTDTIEIGFDGADGFGRSLPLEVAQHPDTLLVTGMNGAPLPEPHGGPLRLLVPGWYGMASVKWLRRVTALMDPFRGHFQAERYVIEGRPVTRTLVRAVVSTPVAASRVAGPTVRLAGFAWGGSGRIARVEVSDDGGGRWMEASLGEAAPPYGWTRWSLDWVPSRAGEVAILVRATDSNGEVQPLAPSWNELGYCNNAVVPHQLFVS
jgi:DMSO/TMAO reductase YedYZ molybdopterin-dependent catalytic subunit